MIGSRLLQEALQRQHEVVAFSRNTGQLPQDPNIIASATDVLDSSALTAAVRGTQAIIYAFNSPKGATVEQRVDAQRCAILFTLAAARAAGVPRILAVGGAGTLEVAPGLRPLPWSRSCWQSGCGRAQRKVSPGHRPAAGR
jgi:putative NADH-flavin reductase